MPNIESQSHWIVHHLGLMKIKFAHSDYVEMWSQTIGPTVLQVPGNK